MVAFSAIAEAPPFLTRRNPPEKKASPDKVASVPGAITIPMSYCLSPMSSLIFSVEFSMISRRDF